MWRGDIMHNEIGWMNDDFVTGNVTVRLYHNNGALLGQYKVHTLCPPEINPDLYIRLVALRIKRKNKEICDGIIDDILNGSGVHDNLKGVSHA